MTKEELLNYIIEAFGKDGDHVTKWMETSIPALNGLTPNEMLEKENGVERVLQVVNAIIWGVYL